MKLRITKTGRTIYISNKTTNELICTITGLKPRFYHTSFTLKLKAIFRKIKSKLRLRIPSLRIETSSNNVKYLVDGYTGEILYCKEYGLCEHFFRTVFTRYGWVI